MSKKRFGPSLYYASDKNIFDALTQHKVDNGTIASLFMARNILVGKATPREDLAEYFSRLNHDYYDHQNIAERLGIVPKRERVTSMEIEGGIEADLLLGAINAFKADAESLGDTVHISRFPSGYRLSIQYAIFDYKRTEFSQLQVRDGEIEFEKSERGYVVRSTKNDYIDSQRDTLLAKLDKALPAPASRRVVSLFEFTDPRVRSKFFYDLVTTLPEYSMRDVTAVYVYKQGPDEEGLEGDEFDTHVERIQLRGHGVSQSELLRELLDEDEYYIFKIAWRTKEILGSGFEYDIEALFVNPKECVDFSFILDGVYVVEQGQRAKRRRVPTTTEIGKISRVVEDRAKALIDEINTSSFDVEG